jgi:spermidine synthase
MRSTLPVTVLLFCSGLCALVYQSVWLREFRLVFGASTAATAAVLAIFMAGLGAGSIILGRRADAVTRPLAFYGVLELVVALSAAVSTVLLPLAGRLYVSLGGSPALGSTGATVVRLLLSLLVIGIPTFAMGGTLPAAAQAAESGDDRGRRKLAALYGANTLGAVTGAVISTFYLLEHLGNRATLSAAVILNVVVGVTAWMIGVRQTTPQTTGPPTAAVEASAPPALVLTASALVGFAFLLMEIVWYRMLGPLLGGSTFSFGLILALALLGIGLGGLAFSMRDERARPTLSGFALSCTFEALALGLPFALGDRLAIAASLLRNLGSVGFGGFVLGWTLVTAVVVLPAALVAGYQFPLLIALLGEGREGVGHDVGRAYAFNTLGAIAGSLAGGFGLLPLLTAPGCWRLAAGLLDAIGIVAIAVALKRKDRAMTLLSSAAAIAAATSLFAMGPTGAWRHSGIGAGRSETTFTSINSLRDWVHGHRRVIVWEADGRESSVALSADQSFAFIMNGKSDGNVRGDAGTQVMSGLVGAVLHGHVTRAMVIGLGTGSTAGWLASIPSVRRVDVAELEPVVVRVAQACASANNDVLRNPKVRLSIGDARELLLTSRQRYDVIFSEPSNPYRAGIASLFTREFYASCASRLTEDGLFLQWVQAYSVDATTVRVIFATISDVFPAVETWQTATGDLLLVASQRPVVHDFAAMRSLVATEPFHTAMSKVWRTESLEGFQAHFVANDDLARAAHSVQGELNTDDRTLVEFGFARGLNSRSQFSLDDLVRIAQRHHVDRPVSSRGAIDWRRVDEERASVFYVNALPQPTDGLLFSHHKVATEYEDGNLADAAAEWRRSRWAPLNSGETLALAESLADSGSAEALPWIGALTASQPVEAEATLALLRLRQNRVAEAATLLADAFRRSRTDPWPSLKLLDRSIERARGMAFTDPQTASLLYESLRLPFAVGMEDDQRRTSALAIASAISSCGAETLRAAHALEPNPPWRGPVLKLRAECYSRTNDPLAESARDDWAQFVAAEPAPLLP